MQQEIKVHFEQLFGYIRLRTSIVPDKDVGIVFMGGSEHYDKDGNLVKIVKPTPLGKIVYS